MKDGLLYLIFMIFTLMFVASKQSDIQQSHQEKSSIEFSIAKHNIVGTVSESNFSFKKVEVFSFLSFFIIRNIDTSKVIRNSQLLASCFKQNQAIIINIQNYHKKPFLIKLYSTNNSKDSYHLS